MCGRKAAALIVALTVFPLVMSGTERFILRDAAMLYEAGQLKAAAGLFGRSAAAVGGPGAMTALCLGGTSDPNAEWAAREHLKDFPESVSRNAILYNSACSAFAEGSYSRVLELLEGVKVRALPRSERDGMHFRMGYSYFMEGYWDSAAEVLSRTADGSSDYAAPSAFVLGYMSYAGGRFRDAVRYFSLSGQDGRFALLSAYYTMECRFLMEDYEYVVSMAEKGMVSIEGGDYGKNVARMVSESYMALGRASEARRFYESYYRSRSTFDRNDFFYAGMMAYGIGNYRDAVSNLSNVSSGADSLAQVALYYQAYSYVQTGNKLEALESFRRCSSMTFDGRIAEDAMFNYAKLAFDVNGDMSGFESYIAGYPSSAKKDEIYGYMASAHMMKRDYASAIDIYRKMGQMNSAASDSFREALFLRSMQLVSSGSYSQTVPLLKQVLRIKEGDRLAFLAGYWLSEAYYRMDDFASAASICRDLSRKREYASMPEFAMLPYNLGYDLFKSGDYAGARDSFNAYLKSSPVFRREAQLRVADCSFMLQDYEQAAAMYEKCAGNYYDSNDIYPLYQGALAYGLTGAEAKKIAMLERVAAYDPGVRFYDEAMFELGRSYVRIDNDTRAEEVFRKLASGTRDSTIIAGVNIELGSLYRNRKEYDMALQYYKSVVETMPLSREAQDALVAIESIYQSRNRPEDYLAYIESIGKASIKTEDEKDDMIFSGAEQTFLKGDYNSALVSLGKYIDKYPSGRNLSQAYYYIGESQKELGRYEKALDAFYKVMSIGEGAFAESATLNYAELSYRLERYQQAYEGYSTLGEIARMENNVFVSLLGVMRSRYRLKEYMNAKSAADDVMASPACDSAAWREAMYVKAKSCIALSDRQGAAPLLAELASAPDTPEGAEASYLLIQELYDSGRFGEVADRVYAFAEKASGQTYFLARAFIVLGDAFAEMDDWEQAKATFASIKDNYKPVSDGDDVLAQVEMRLKRIAELGAADADNVEEDSL